MGRSVHVLFGLILFGLVLFGLVLFGLVLFGLVLLGLAAHRLLTRYAANGRAQNRTADLGNAGGRFRSSGPPLSF
jgi:hypothetical protein